MTILRRAAVAIAVVGLLSLQAGAVCAGWQSSPDARMDCCARESACPMDAPTARSGHGDHGAPSPDPAADACCAMSEPGSAARGIPAPAPLVAATLDGATVSASQPLAASRVPRLPVPPPPGLARHVLLSVFLV